MDDRSHCIRERELMGPGGSAAVQWAGLVVASAQGSWVRDVAGRSYLDFMGAAGVNLIGHSHPRLVAAIADQAGSWMIGAHASSARLALLEKLEDILPGECLQTQFYSGGSEAVEAALRLAKSATGRSGFLSFWNAFHGRTAASLALTPGAQKGYGAAVGGIAHTPYADCGACALRLRLPSCALACVDHAHEVARQSTAWPLAGIIVEPVQGRAGNVVPPAGYLASLKRLANDVGALLIVDESMTGFGRTGEMFAVEHDGITPDVLILGKGMGGGYPVSAVVAHRDLVSAHPYGLPSASSSSFGGFPMACRSSSIVLDILEDEGLVMRSREMGEVLLKLLRSALSNLSIVGDIRGQGLALGVGLVDRIDGRTPLQKDTMRSIVSRLTVRGLLVMVGGSSIRLYPPLNVTHEEMERAVALLADVLGKVGEGG